MSTSFRTPLRQTLLVSILAAGLLTAPLTLAHPASSGQTPLAEPGALRGLLLQGVELAQAPAGTPGQPIPSPPSKGMMIAGWATLGGGYVFTVLVGLVMLEWDADPTRTCTNCEQVGTMFMIPIVGPFIAIPDADGTDGKVVAALLGIVQVAGAVLGTVGTILYHTGLAEYEDAISGSGVALGGGFRLDVGVGGPRGDAPMIFVGSRF